MHQQNPNFLIGGTNTGAAIDQISKEGFNVNKGARTDEGVPKILIVLTDGKSNDDVTNPASNVRKNTFSNFHF